MEKYIKQLEAIIERKIFQAECSRLKALQYVRRNLERSIGQMDKEISAIFSSVRINGDFESVRLTNHEATKIETLKKWKVVEKEWCNVITKEMDKA